MSEKTEHSKLEKLICVELEGLDWGKHILFIPNYFTLCGMPTIDTPKNVFPALNDKCFDDIIFKYKEVKWEITCKKCLEMIEMTKKIKQSKPQEDNDGSK